MKYFVAGVGAVVVAFACLLHCGAAEARQGVCEERCRWDSAGRRICVTRCR